MHTVPEDGVRRALLERPARRAPGPGAPASSSSVAGTVIPRTVGLITGLLSSPAGGPHQRATLPAPHGADDRAAFGFNTSCPR